MKDLELVSVIIPAFNAQDFIAETIDSVLAQTYPNIEVIVVDDGSTDQTSQIVQKYGKRVRYLYQPNSGGCSSPRNKGILSSSGNFLCFIDADDIMLSDRIDYQIDFMMRHSDVGLVFCDYKNFTIPYGMFQKTHFQSCPRLWPLLKDKTELVIEQPCRHLVEENFGIAGTMFVRKKILAYEPGFTTELTACEDFHFYFRVARHFRVGVVNKVGMMRRLHNRNMSSNTFKMLSQQIHSRTLLRDSEEDPQVRDSINRYIVHCKGGLARFCANQGAFLESLRYDWLVLSGPFFWPETGRALRNIMRTILMAAGLYGFRGNK